MAHDLRVQLFTAGKAWWQDCETAGHVAPTDRKQREAHAGVPFTFSVLFRLDPGLERVLPTLRLVFHPQNISYFANAVISSQGYL